MCNNFNLFNCSDLDESSSEDSSDDEETPNKRIQMEASNKRIQMETFHVEDSSDDEGPRKRVYLKKSTNEEDSTKTADKKPNAMKDETKT